MEQKKKVRLDNIELLRIIAMLMVVTLHFLGRGGVHDHVRLFSQAYFVSSVWDAVSMVSVNVYVLISGYFLVRSKFKGKKLFRLIVQVFTWSFGLYLLCVAFGLAPFSLSSLVKSAFPLLTYQYWFASAYVGLYILFPFLNYGIRAMNEKQHRILCILLIALFTLYLPSKALVVNGYSIMWMISLYVIGAYLSLYYHPTGKVTWKQILFYLVPTILLPCSRFAIDIAGKLLGKEALASTYSKFFYKNNSVFVCLSAVALFILFLNVRIQKPITQKIIRFAAPLTFGVYLVHNNPTLRETLWDLVRPYTFMNHWWFFFAGCGIILLIFTASALLEFCRKTVYNKLSETKIVQQTETRLLALLRRKP